MVDAWSDVRKFNLEGAQGFRVAQQVVVGILVDEDDERYVLASDWWDVEGDVIYDHPHVIAKQMVRAITVLEDKDVG
jgi:hypothetical protein